MKRRWMEMDGITHLIASLQYDVRAAQEARYGLRVRVEETLLDLGNTVSAPVDLYELGELALSGCK